MTQSILDLRALASLCRRDLGACSGATGFGAATGRDRVDVGRAYLCVRRDGGNVLVVDPEKGQLVEKIAVGKRPRGIRLSVDGKQLFVALSGSPIAGPARESKLPPADRSADGIGVVDLATRTLVRKLKSGQGPESFALSPDGKRIYVSNEETSEMSVLDLASGDVTTRVKVGEEPEGVTVRPDGREVYVTSEGDNAVFAVDTTSYAVVAKMETAARPRAVVFTPDGSTAFVTNENGAAITVIDAGKHAVTTTIKLTPPPGATVPPRPMGATLSADARRLFVSLGRAKSLAEIDVATRQVVRAMDDIGARPWGIGLSKDGKKLYTANGPSADVFGRRHRVRQGRPADCGGWKPVGHRRRAGRIPDQGAPAERRRFRGLCGVQDRPVLRPRVSSRRQPPERWPSRRVVHAHHLPRRDSGNGETPNSTALVSVRPFHGVCVLLLFSSQMPTHGKSARSHT